MIVCRECGRHNDNGTTFCANRDYGAFLEWSGDPVATEVIRIRPRRPCPAGAPAGGGASGPPRWA